MQKIIVTFTNAQGQITRQVLTRSEGQALSLAVPPGVQVAVQVQTPTPAAGQAAAPKSLQARPRGRDLLIEADGDILLNLHGLDKAPNTTLHTLEWAPAQTLAAALDTQTREAANAQVGQDSGAASTSGENSKVGTVTTSGTTSTGLGTLGALAVGLGVAAAAGSGGQTPPTPTSVTLSDNVAGVANGPVTFTIAFSQPVSGFDISKLTLSGGTLGTLVASADGKTFTVTAIPELSTSGSLRLSLNTTGITDAAGQTIAAPAAAEQAFSQNVVQGAIVAGPVTPDHQLLVKVFGADGQLLATAVPNASGSYTVSLGNYTGAFYALVVDSGSGSDYVDEVTKQPIDLSSPLMAAGIVDNSSGVQTFNINPLTTVAALKAGVTVGADASALQVGSATAATVTAANTAVAKALLGDAAIDLLRSTIVPTVNVDGTPNSGANGYGKMLAVLAGMDAANDGNSSQTFNTLVSGISDSGTLASNVQTAITDGASQAGVSTSELPVLMISGLSASVTVAENTADTSATPTLSGAIGAVTWSLEGADKDLFTVGANGVVSMIARDFESPADASGDNV